MAFPKLLTMSFRGLLRNGRRTALTALAVALGLVVAMTMSGLLEGMVASALADNIRLSTGHVQVRNAEYDLDKQSLVASELLRDSDGLAAQFEAHSAVRAAAPVLWTSGLLGTAQESVGIEILGIDPADSFHAPLREGVTAGAFLAPDDRGLLLIGEGLARDMEISVGQRVSLAASNADGQGQEGVFTVAGLIDTGFPSYDQNRVILPLRQAQSFSGVGDRVSSVILTLDDPQQAEAVAAELQSAEMETFTWRDLNALLLESVETGLIYYYILYVIVFLAVAVLIANTLLMSVFERQREIGVLTSLGMSGRQVMTMILTEALLLGVFGVGVGLVLGSAAVGYLTYVGIPIGAETAAMVEGMAIGTRLYGGFAPQQFAILSLLLLAVVAVVSLYPAWFAARLEPVEALHAL